MTAIAVLKRYLSSGTFAARIITIKAESEMIYGTTLVTTARLTRAENCLLKLGEIVESARTDCTTPRTIIPVMGAPNRLTFVKKAGNMRCSAADLPVCAMVNCQPSSEPRQASTARAMMMEPIVGLNILA